MSDFVRKFGTEKNAYGLCPRCGKPGESRERCINGNDTCAAGHVYPSKSAVNAPKGPSKQAAVVKQKQPGGEAPAEDKRTPAQVQAKKLFGHNPATGRGGALQAVIDTLRPLSYGGQRAGRMEGLASSYGVRTPYATRHPGTSSLLAAAGGSVLGTAAGAVAESGTHTGLRPGSLPVLGSVLGSASGVIAMGIVRARQRKKLMQQVLAAEQAGVAPDPTRIRESGTASQVFGPFGGPHAMGRATAGEVVRGDSPAVGLRGVAGTLADHSMPVLSGWGQHVVADAVNDKYGSAKRAEQAKETLYDRIARLAQGAAEQALNADPYVPAPTSGAAGNIMASVRNMNTAGRFRGDLTFRPRQVGRTVPMLSGAAIGAAIGGMPDDEQTRDEVTIGADGRESTRSVTTRRPMEERILRGIVGAGLGAGVGSLASRGYMGRKLAQATNQPSALARIQSSLAKIKAEMATPRPANRPALTPGEWMRPKAPATNAFPAGKSSALSIYAKLVGTHVAKKHATFNLQRPIGMAPKLPSGFASGRLTKLKQLRPVAVPPVGLTQKIPSAFAR